MSETKLSPVEFEQQLLNQVNEQTPGDPLDVHAAMFKYYNPRFQGQLNWMSKKEIVKLAMDVAGCEFNKNEDINKIAAFSKDLGLKALQRVIGGVVEHPLADIDLKLTVELEKKLFILLDSLLTNKYYNFQVRGLELQKENPDKKLELNDIVVHNLDMNSKEFQKLKKVQKDAFITANNLLHSKFWMMRITHDQYLEAHPEILEELNKLKEKNNG